MILYMSQNEDLKFSITVHTDNQELIGFLSVVAHISQPENRRQIHVEGQKEGNWERNGHHAIFHFSETDHRQQFIEAAKGLYGDAWEIKDMRDNDPPCD